MVEAAMEETEVVATGGQKLEMASVNLEGVSWKHLFMFLFLACHFGKVTAMDEEEGFLQTEEFYSIMVGVAGFWGGVFSTGGIYLLMVLAKRCYNPEEAIKAGN